MSMWSGTMTLHQTVHDASMNIGYLIPHELVVLLFDAASHVFQVFSMAADGARFSAIGSPPGNTVAGA
jgi:hypothetical protein